MGILQRTKKSMVRVMCGVQLKDRKDLDRKIYGFDVGFE